MAKPRKKETVDEAYIQDCLKLSPGGRLRKLEEMLIFFHRVRHASKRKKGKA